MKRVTMMNKRNIGKSLLCGLAAFTMMTGCGNAASQDQNTEAGTQTESAATETSEAEAETTVADAETETEEQEPHGQIQSMGCQRIL